MGIHQLAQRMRDARQAAGLTQSRLAQEAGCNQSAISMLERGQSNVLSQESLTRLATRLGLDLQSLAETPGEIDVPCPPTVAAPDVYRYCPHYDCPSNTPYVVRGDLYLLPRMAMGEPRPSPRCRLCGEVLEACCANAACNAPARPGSCCPDCGTRYVAPPTLSPDARASWADRQRRQVAVLFESGSADGHGATR